MYSNQVIVIHSSLMLYLVLLFINEITTNVCIWQLALQSEHMSVDCLAHTISMIEHYLAHKVSLILPPTMCEMIPISLPMEFVAR
jgi:hypothetical protein